MENCVISIGKEVFPVIDFVLVEIKKAETMNSVFRW